MLQAIKISVLVLFLSTATSVWAGLYPVVDTGQNGCYDNHREIAWPTTGQPFYRQDAQQQGNQPSYRDNDDGTITDFVTGLTWGKARGEKMTWNAAIAGASRFRAGCYSDWRMPTIKELYSLINFNGGFNPRGNSVPYLDTHFFEFKYGDQSKGERGIDCQDWSATEYLGTTMNGKATVFGVNFADGRIKGYPKRHPQKGQLKLYVRYVRGNPNYGKNNLHENGNGTVTDRATGLDGPRHLQGSAAIYLAFGRATGWMPPRPGMGGSGQRGPRRQNDSGSRGLLDVHGAGAQRSDPKVGNPDDYPRGRGPQGDVIRICNYVRLARDEGL